MLNVKKLQAIRDKILGVAVNPAKYGDLNSVVYLQQILDAVQGVTSTPARVQGNLNEKIYLQKIRNAKLGVADGQFGSLANSVYLQQIINAYNSVADKQFGSLSENTYLDAWFSVAAVSAPVIPWYLSGGISAANCVAAYRAIGAASYAASKVNLANPGTFNLTDPAAPSWAALDGWTGNGTKYLDTGIVPGNNKNWSMIIRFSNFTDTTFNKNLCGAAEAGSYFQVLKTNTVALFGFGYAAQLQFQTSALSAGVLAVTKTAPYRNGVAETWSVAPGNFSIPTNSIQIFAVNGSGGTPAPAKIQAFAVYNIDTSLSVAALTTAMAALT